MKKSTSFYLSCFVEDFESCFLKSVSLFYFSGRNVVLRDVQGANEIQRSLKQNFHYVAQQVTYKVLKMGKAQNET